MHDLLFDNDYGWLRAQNTVLYSYFFPCLCSSFGVSGAKLLMPRTAILHLFALGQGSLGNDLTGCPGKSWVRDD